MLVVIPDKISQHQKVYSQGEVIMCMKNNLSDYTEHEFELFINDIFRENIAENDEKLDELLEHFEKITSHPDASDLFFYTLEDDQCTPDGITKYIKEWRKSQGLPLFKDSK